ncbi:reverse transcriptase domain-containing protein [Variovorax atrisoli]|uniref:reverse transcriptase domain-containing protein n=1 Tax=Variovorax atrisoli TaxID=3394203 RepID=UPI00119F21E6|nr:MULTISPECIES: reverse transcriptase domain-containing protein [Variovorax]MBB3641191.1 S1-C subfamily serine protease [Variovorax sp. BK613]MDR6522763.1 S1-C subfamily serine protease [Variovorax paradoxus]
MAFLGVKEFHDYMLRSDVPYFSRHIFRAEYSSVEGYLYPHPRYTSFVLAKANGKNRFIAEPSKKIKELQYRALRYLEKTVPQPKACVHGFVEGRSILTNARKHLERRPYHILNLDLTDFFPSITFFRVRGALMAPPMKFSFGVATMLAHLCTHEGTLPQGAPTSPFLANLICRSLDSQLTLLSKRHRATYTRYADDLTFSFSHRHANRLPANIVNFDGGTVSIGSELRSIIESNSFGINNDKTRVSTRMRRMEITGVVVNEDPNVTRKFIDKIRGALHAWDRYGYVAALANWNARVAETLKEPRAGKQWARQTRTGNIPSLQNVLWGRLLFVRMIRGDDDLLYTRLAEKYNHLCRTHKAIDPEFRAASLPIALQVKNSLDADFATFVFEWSADYAASDAHESEPLVSQGSAFAYGDGRRFITCDHVLKGQSADGEVDVANPRVRNLTMNLRNPVTRIDFQARVLHRDAHLDLAVLELVDPAARAKRYFDGRTEPLERDARARLIGFPNWTQGRTANNSVVSVQQRFPRAGLQRIEIGGSMIRQGNSGGPLVDASYKLAGVAQQGASQSSGNDECLCIMELDRWLASL